MPFGVSFQSTSGSPKPIATVGDRSIAVVRRSKVEIEVMLYRNPKEASWNQIMLEFEALWNVTTVTPGILHEDTVLFILKKGKLPIEENAQDAAKQAVIDYLLEAFEGRAFTISW